MNVLRIGSQGPEVVEWQNFLLGQGTYQGEADGKYGPKSQTGTLNFQTRHGLVRDGTVNRLTFAKAVELGFRLR